MKIGVILPLSHPQSDWLAEPALDGIRLAAELSDSRPLAGERVELVVRDDRGDPERAASLVHLLSRRDRVDAIVGPATTPLAISGAETADRVGVPLVAIAVTAEITRGRESVFKILPDFQLIVDALADFVGRVANARRLLIVTASRFDAMVTYETMMSKRMLSYGVVVDTVAVPGLSPDVATSIDAVFSRPLPDILFVNLPGPDRAAEFVASARERGLPASVRILGSDQMETPRFAKQGGAATVGSVFPTFYVPQQRSPQNIRFVRLYRARHGHSPGLFAACGYAALTMVAAAGREAPKGSGVGVADRRAAIRRTIAHLSGSATVLGDGMLTMGENRSPEYPVRMMEWKANGVELAS
jgi:branched-chain amino acid transport system substrate-binding protein